MNLEHARLELATKNARIAKLESMLSNTFVLFNSAIDGVEKTLSAIDAAHSKTHNSVVVEAESFDWSNCTEQEIRDAVRKMLEEKAEYGLRLVAVLPGISGREWYFSK